jgi:glycosyltransferase involved in cell wall biosynthesis
MIQVLYFNYSSALGGAERSLLDILKNLDRGRFTPLLLTFGEGPFERAAAEAGVRVVRLPEETDLSRFRRGALFIALLTGLFRLPGLIRQIRGVRRVLKEITPDLIHTNNPKSHVMGALAAVGLGLRLVIHVRDIFGRFSLSRLLLRLAVGLNRSRIVCISEAVRKSLPAGLQSRAIVIYNGFPQPEIKKGREKVRLELGMGYGEKIIVSAGRIVPWKGFPLLISAMAPLLRGGGCRLVIMGDALYWNKGYPDSVKKCAQELGVADRVVFTGFVERPEDVFAAADVFVLPSRMEPFGRVLVEAMLCGLPVAAFDEAGPREIVTQGRTGILVAPGDGAALCAAIHGLLSDEAACKAMGRAAREEAKERFPIQRTVTQLESLYDAITGRHASE